MRQIPRLYRQNIRPVIMNREAHLDAFRGMRDLEPGLTIDKYCFDYNVSLEDREWMARQCRQVEFK